MVANVQAKNISLLIDSADYSPYFVEMSVGWDSWQSGSGLRLKSGEISLCSIQGGVSLDPRDNTDFAVGNLVQVVWGTVSHPLASELLITAPPTIEPILSSLPTAGDNLVVKIPVGCTLSYYQAYEPDDDKSGIELGQGVEAAELVERLLLAAGIPAGDINIQVSDLANEFDYPIQKFGGGFVDMAGEVAYCCGGDGPGYLYCNRDNVVKVGILDIDADSTLEIGLGVEDRAYEPQLDGSLPPGFVKAVGIRRRVLPAGPACTKTQYEEPDVTKQEFEVCKYESKSLVLRPTKDMTFYGDLILYQQFFDARYISEKSETTEYVTMYGTRQNGTTYVRGKDWKTTNRTFTQSLYMGDGLRIKVEEIYANRGAISSELSAALVVNNVPTIANTYYTLEHSQTTVTRYEYNSDGEVKAESIEVWLPGATIAPQDYEIGQSQAWDLRLAEKKRSEWSQDRGVWTEKVTNTRARGLVDSEFLEDPEASPGLSYYDLIPTADNKSRISNTGDTQPPRPETWEPTEATEEEDQLEAEAVFERSRQRVVLQVPYAFTVAQLQNLAQVEGEIIWGRAYQYRIECEPSIFQSEQTPHPIVRVRGGGENRIFLADAIQWAHTASESYVGFAGIYLGGSGGDPGTAGSFRRTRTIAPLIQQPSGGTTVGTETPTGQPRQPLPLDGVLMVGIYSILTEGLFTGLLTEV